MTSCSSTKTYSFEEASGFEVTSLNSIVASESVYQSLAWPISDEVYEYLDLKFVKANFNMQKVAKSKMGKISRRIYKQNEEKNYLHYDYGNNAFWFYCWNIFYSAKQI